MDFFRSGSCKNDSGPKATVRSEDAVVLGRGDDHLGCTVYGTLLKAQGWVAWSFLFVCRSGCSGSRGVRGCATRLGRHGLRSVALSWRRFTCPCDCCGGCPHCPALAFGHLFSHRVVFPGFGRLQFFIDGPKNPASHLLDHERDGPWYGRAVSLSFYGPHRPPATTRGRKRAA